MAVAGVLDADDTDVFRLELVGSAEIEVRTTGQTDTRGELIDSTGARLMSDDDSGLGDTFSITAELQPGVYYVEVQGGPGTYTAGAGLVETATTGTPRSRRRSSSSTRRRSSTPSSRPSSWPRVGAPTHRRTTWTCSGSMSRTTAAT